MKTSAVVKHIPYFDKSNFPAAFLQSVSHGEKCGKFEYFFVRFIYLWRPEVFMKTVYLFKTLKKG